ncbi:hypothetical protein F0562_009165 [Nyssa sinensis]|uniref:RING-type E3 ubiquitin transferase n=1 Tax=Nyssa sinensis TaxID=561372 RepID=A0A5J4ZV18_9ASTE|nr:hypothetical protein F0562_009165 [Nyssa sinensis]
MSNKKHPPFPLHVKCNEVILEDIDIAKALCDYVELNLVETLVLGAVTRSAFVRFKTTDVPSSVSKAAPEFCTVYVISKGKFSSIQSASSCPVLNPPHGSLQNSTSRVDRKPSTPWNLTKDDEIRSPFNRVKVQT